MLANNKGIASVVGLAIIVALIGFSFLHLSYLSSYSKISKYGGEQIQDFYDVLSELESEDIGGRLPLLYYKAQDIYEKYLSRGYFCDVSQKEVISREGKSFKNVYAWSYEKEDNFIISPPLLENRFVSSNTVILQSPFYEDVKPKSIFIDVFYEKAKTSLPSVKFYNCDATLVYSYNDNRYVKEFYFIINNFTSKCTFVIQDDIKGVAYRTYSYILDRDRQKLSYLLDSLNLDLPEDIVFTYDYLEELSNLPDSVSIPQIVLFEGFDLTFDDMELINEINGILKESSESVERAFIYLISKKDYYLNKYVDSAGNFIKSREKEFAEEVYKTIGIKLNDKDLKDIEALLGKIKRSNEKLDALLLSYMNQGLPDTPYLNIEGKQINVDATVMGGESIALPTQELKKYAAGEVHIDLTPQEINDIKNVLNTDAKDLDILIKKCIMWDAKERFEGLQDIAEISFSEEYDVSTAFDRFSNIFNFDSNSLDKSIEESVQQLQSQGLSREEANIVIEVIAETQAKTKGELKSIAQSIQDRKIKEALIKASNLPNLPDQLIANIENRLENEVKDTIINAVAPHDLISTCNPAILNTMNYYSNAKAAIKLVKNFDSTRLATLKQLFPYFKTYETFVKEYEGLKEDVKVSKEACNALLSLKSLKKIKDLLNAAEDLEIYGDDYSVCLSKEIGKEMISALVLDGLNEKEAVVSFEDTKVMLEDTYSITLPSVYTAYFELEDAREEERYNHYIKGKNIIENIKRELKEYLNNKEKSFSITTFSCGSCDYLPDPIERLSEEEVLNKVKGIVKKYNNKDTNVEVVDVEIEDVPLDKSRSRKLTGCLCGTKTAKVCITEYKHIRKIRIKLKIQDGKLYSGWEFVVSDD